MSVPARWQANSYDEIAVVAFRPYGHQAKLFVSGCVFGLCSLGAVGYTILLGDLLTPLAVKALHHGSIFAKREIVQLIAIACSYPFCLLKDISSLRYTSCIAIVAILFLSVAMIYRPPLSSLLSSLAPHLADTVLYWSGRSSQIWVILA